MAAPVSGISLDEMIEQARAVEEQARRMHDAAVDHLRSLEAAAGAEAPTPSAAPEDIAWVAEWIDLPTAAVRMRSDRDTARKKAIKFGLGRKSDGRWWIDWKRVSAWREWRE